MARFVDISSDPESPVLIDAEAVTAVQIFPQKDGVGETIHISGAQGRIFLCEDNHGKNGWNIDADGLCDKLKGAGKSLVSLPSRAEDGTVNAEAFIDPAAVNFVTTSSASVSGQGGCGIIVGLPGVWRLERYDATAEDRDGLIAAVKSAKPDMISFKPHEARARWFDAKDLLIDPAAITRIKEAADMLYVSFDRDQLDVNIGLEHNDRSEAASNIANDLLQKEEEAGVRRNLNDIFREAKALVATSEKMRRRIVAERIAQTNPDLVDVPGAVDVTYVQPDDIAYIQAMDPEKQRQHKFGLFLVFKNKGREDRFDTEHIYFETDDARQQGLAALNRPRSTAPAPQTCPPSP